MHQRSSTARSSLLPYPVRDLQAAREAVIARARALTEEAIARHPGWDPPPFDPEYCAEAISIPVVFTDRVPGWDALLVPTGSGAQIICSDAGRSWGRIRFSIAHEIIHTFFQNTEGVYHLRTADRRLWAHSPEARDLERLCDLGAAELLMPMPIFRRAVIESGLRASAVPEIAARFEVSLEAAAVRMVEAAATPVVIGFFTFGAQPSAARSSGDTRPRRPRRDAYRAHRVFSSPGLALLFPTGKSVPDLSVIYRSSMQFDEMEAIEGFSLGKTHGTFHVTAFPLQQSRTIVEPPTVCAVFRPTEEQAALRRAGSDEAVPARAAGEQG